MAMPKLPASIPPHPSFIANHIRNYRYFFLNLNPPMDHPLTVVCGGREHCASDYRVERDNFEYYGLEFVAGGKGWLTLDGIKVALLPGSVFGYPPFTAHLIETDPHDPLIKYFITFAGSEAGKIINPQSQEEHHIAHLYHSQPIHDLFEQVLEAGDRGGNLAPRLCLLLLQLLSVRIEENAQAPSEIHNRARQSFERSRSTLQKHFRTLHSVTELARMAHVAPAYLSRLFHRFVGEGPHDVLTRLKINEAASHLIGGDYTVKEVAEQVGFSDPYHFSRVFKKHYGIAPALFQAAHTRHQL